MLVAFAGCIRKKIDPLWNLACCYRDKWMGKLSKIRAFQNKLWQEAIVPGWQVPLYRKVCRGLQQLPDPYVVYVLSFNRTICEA